MDYLEIILEAMKVDADKKQTISAIRNLEKRIQFHTDLSTHFMDYLDVLNKDKARNIEGSLVVEKYERVFLQWVKQLLPPDKFKVFITLFKHPLQTPALVQSIYTELERVFYSRNSNENRSFNSETALNDWLEYKKNHVGSPFWRNKAWEVLKTKPNSIVVVDLPSIQHTEKPEPYVYFVGMENVVNYKTINGTDLLYVLYKVNDTELIYIDSQCYVVGFWDGADTQTLEIMEPSFHGLGYTPARFFWTDSVSSNKPDIKQNPITKELCNLDWLLFFSTSKKHLDLYAPYPIYSAYEFECDFKTAEGDFCHNGFLKNSEGVYRGSHILEPCPLCESKKLAGPGSLVTVPIPQQGIDGTADLKNPVQITTVDNNSLSYNTTETERLANLIKISCVGSNGMVSEKEAINETQVSANFENKTAALIDLKKNFELIQMFIENTMCKLRYADAFNRTEIDWGTEFYVFSVEDLYIKYENAKKTNMPNNHLDSILEQIVETEYKNNPAIAERIKLLDKLEPYRHISIQDALTLLEKELISKEDLELKINFSNVISNFEETNGDIVAYLKSVNNLEKVRNEIRTFKKQNNG